MPPDETAPGGAPALTQARTNDEHSSTGFDQNLTAAAAYLAGPLSGVILLIVEQDSALVLFHAAQSTLASIAVLATLALLLQVPAVGWFLALVLGPPAAFAAWLAMLVQTYRGRRLALPVLGSLAQRCATRLAARKAAR